MFEFTSPSGRHSLTFKYGLIKSYSLPKCVTLWQFNFQMSRYTRGGYLVSIRSHMCRFTTDTGECWGQSDVGWQPWSEADGMAQWKGISSLSHTCVSVTNVDHIYSTLQEQNPDGTACWKPTFAAVTQQDLLLYGFAPTLKSEWASPRRSRPLIATRYVRRNCQEFTSSSHGIRVLMLCVSFQSGANNFQK